MGADASGRVALDWGLYGVPETYVIDGEGNIVLRFAGPITERSLEAQIRPAIEAAQGQGGS
jgi:cytochrome c biogenesis protein CcmG/thiol:disulfide interchange protein DsbE